MREGRPDENGIDARRAEPSAAASAERPSGVGPYLAAQRRLRGISLDELADRTKIPRRNLERLESGAFDAAPDGFTRGFVRTVADALGLDPDEAVMRLMCEPAADDAELASARRIRALLLGAGLCALAAVVLILLIRFASAWLAPGAPAPSETVYRRDAVRSLAEVAREREENVPAVDPREPDPGAGGEAQDPPASRPGAADSGD